MNKMPVVFRKLFALCLLAAMLAFANTNLAQAGQIITIESGQIEGASEDGVACFKGIPYAAPPVGELRWRPPVAPEKWDGVREVKEYANEAAQNADLGVFAYPGGSEDCLYLNVFVPEKALTSKEKLPVFFWIHGGGLFVGSSADYNTNALVKEGNAVVVTINYRLGALGFFAHPAIDAENHAIANYGLMDQVFALEWVQRNIENFGGDPENITIAGESSGGQSVLAMMTSPKTEGKFSAAIGMSACTVTLHSGFTMYPLAEAERQGIALAEEAGLTNATAEELRNLPVEKILQAQKPFATFIIEGDYVPEHIGDALQNGHVHPVTFVNGTVRNEGSFFEGLRETFAGKPMTAGEYPQVVKDFCSVFEGDVTDKVLAEYPLTDYATPSEAYAAIITDAWFATTADNINRTLADKIPVYAYEFDDQTAPYYLPTSFRQGAAHTYEIPYIFPGFHGSSELSTQLNAKQEKLSREMVRLFTHVVDLPKQRKWQPYDKEKGNYLRLTLPKPVMTNGEYRKAHHIAFWDEVLAK
ncbi:MAG: carboxylesterase family protein [Selenomonadaceae bacterium]|nr:carboxylesterase family protein [Selenomonadaceae bacterium]